MIWNLFFQSFQKNVTFLWKAKSLTNKRLLHQLAIRANYNIIGKVVYPHTIPSFMWKLFVPVLGKNFIVRFYDHRKGYRKHWPVGSIPGEKENVGFFRWSAEASNIRSRFLMHVCCPQISKAISLLSESILNVSDGLFFCFWSREYRHM